MRRPAIAALLATLIAALSAGPAQAVRGLTTGFTDDVYFDGGAQPWVARTVSSGARIVLLDVDWAGVAPATPGPGFSATNPLDPGYSWGALDGAIRSLSAAGLQVALMVSDAPRWAEGPGAPAGRRAGSWRPDPAAFGQFATAISRRYSGSTPDPAMLGALLPRVRYWQAWTEPNLAIHLSPQWVRSGRGFAPASPVIYRSLLNAFYASVKAVHPDNVVITAGTTPYGDPRPGAERMQPVEFVREMLCLHGAGLALERCPGPAHFDVLAHHPYEVGSPTTRALNADDASAPDLGKLSRPVAVAERRGRALPAGPKRLWVSEFSYDSNPPNPQAISEATQARWLEQALYVFWRQGVDTVVWYLIRDQAPIPSYAAAYESGVYLRDGTPKPSLQAFRFPFVVVPGTHGGLLAWGKSPAAGTVLVERRSAGRWLSVARVRVGAGAVFTRVLLARGHGSYRAVVGTQSSLPWQR